MFGLKKRNHQNQRNNDVRARDRYIQQAGAVGHSPGKCVILSKEQTRRLVLENQANRRRDHFLLGRVFWIGIAKGDR